MTGARTVSVVGLLATALLLLACNNPFSTRTPEQPGTEGAAIKPPISPENVISNLEASFESLSIQDWLAVYDDQFAFVPDPADSVVYEEIFRSGWTKDTETDFAYNYLQRNRFSPAIDHPIEMTISFTPGVDRYDCYYHVFIAESDSTAPDQIRRIEVEGEAWLYFHETNDGTWAIDRWTDFRTAPEAISWGELRARNI